MKKTQTALATALCLSSLAANADYYGTLSGRSANPANNPQLSVEGSFAISGDYQNIGARVNYTVNEKLTVYGDFGLSELGASDGNSFGGGLFYYLPDLGSESSSLSAYDFAVQGSFHMAPLSFGDFDYDITAFGAALLVSPKTAINPESGLNWYANAGLTRLTVDYDFENFGFRSSVNDSSIEIQLGGGVYMPLGPGTVYAGADLLDEFIFAAGYRFGFN